MFRLEPHQQLKFNDDTYRAVVRGDQPHLMVNADYDGVRIIDCAAGSELGVVSFPEPGFSIYTWLTAPDGSKSYLFSQDDHDYVLEMDLEAKESRKITLGKGFQVATELAWFTPTFHVLDYQNQVWKLEGNTLVLADREVADQVHSKPFRKIIERFVVAKMHGSKGLYVRTRHAPQLLVGYLSLAGGREILVPSGGEIDVAHFQDALFLAFDNEIVQHRAGKSEPVLTPKQEDIAFLQVNAIGDGLLAVLSSTKDYLVRPTGFLDVYRMVEAKAIK